MGSLPRPSGSERSRSFERALDAERFLTDQESRKLRGEWLDPGAGKMHLADFAERLARSHRTPAPIYEEPLPKPPQRAHLTSPRALPLKAVRPLDVRVFISAMLERGLSPTTTRHAYVLLSELFLAAQRDGRIARNPAADVVPPSRRRDEQRFLTAEEVWTLADAIRPRYRALVLTGAYAGLRWGELAGLRIRRLRLLERRIDVAETLVEVGGRLIAGPPKTGPRTVSIPAPLAEELAHHLAAYPPGQERLVFTGPEGYALRHSNFYRREWRPAVGSTGLDPGLRVHDLRHTAVALAISTGAHPKQIQELCGQRSTTPTLNTYGHLFESLQDRLAERLAETFLGSRAGPLRDRDGTGVVAFPGWRPE